jgi:hypothetical protein
MFVSERAESNPLLLLLHDFFEGELVLSEREAGNEC